MFKRFFFVLVMFIHKPIHNGVIYPRRSGQQMTDLELIIGRVIQAFGAGQVRVIQARRQGEKHLVFFYGRGRVSWRRFSFSPAGFSKHQPSVL